MGTNGGSASDEVGKVASYPKNLEPGVTPKSQGDESHKEGAGGAGKGVFPGVGEEPEMEESGSKGD